MNTEPNPSRSAIPLVFGIIHVALAGIGILLAMGGLLVPLLMPNQPNPVRDQFGERGYLAWIVVTTLVGVGWKSLMATSGILLIKGRDQGRRLNNVWAVGSIVIGTALAFITACWLTPAAFEATMAQSKAQGKPMPEGMMAGMKFGMLIGGLVVGLGMAWAYQICALVFLNKPAAKAALQ